MATDMTAIGEQVMGLLNKAYQAGYADGQAALRESVLKATGATAHVPTAKIKGSMPSSQYIIVEPKDSLKAPKGRVGEVIHEVLASHPGLPIVEIEQRALEIDPRISPKSVGNELRRLKGQKYRQGEGKQWFLIG